MSRLAAAASEPARFSLGLGAEVGLADPDQVDRGLRLTPSFAPLPWLSVDATAVLYIQPAGGMSRMPYCTYGDPPLPADPSARWFRAQLAAQALPLGARVGPWSIATGALVGVGLVHTVDDADALMVDEFDPAFPATARQWHPAPAVGLAGRVQRGAWGLTARLERVSYVEQIMSGVGEPENPLLASLELSLQP
jgi:hypothetical protein